MRNERDIDDAIDHAVREIMSVEPRAGFRGRVLGKLDRHEPAAWLTMPRIASAAALFVLVLVGLMTSRSGVDPEPQSTVATNQPAPTVETPAAAPPPVSQPSSEPNRERDVRRLAPVFPEPGAVAAANVAETTTFAPEPRATPRMVIVDGVEAPAIVIKRITLEPVAIAPIVIDPITTPR
jgi:hypothetical protein